MQALQTSKDRLYAKYPKFQNNDDFAYQEDNLEKARAQWKELLANPFTPTSTALETASKQPVHWRVKKISQSHNGWVHAIAFDPGNQWLASGSSDTTIKIWKFPSQKLKKTLTGHVAAVTSLALSDLTAYLYSGGLDHAVKCWDLTTCQVIRDFHDHLSGVLSVDAHPTIASLISSAGRDGAIRVWDIRSRECVFWLKGHENAINCVKMRSTDPQIISAGRDTTVRLWDLRTGTQMQVLTHHNNSVQDLALADNAFSSIAADGVFKCEYNGAVLGHIERQSDSVLRCCSLSPTGILMTGDDLGIARFYEWSTGKSLCKSHSRALSKEKGILAASFDRTGTRLVTGEEDKSVKLWSA